MIDTYKIKRELETERCPDHATAPTIEVHGESIKITTCCEKFSEMLQRRMEKEIDDQVQTSFDNLFGSH